MVDLRERADFGGRTVLVAGAGVAGRSAARALDQLGAHVGLSSAGSAPSDLPPGVGFLGDLTEVPAGTELLMTSPGLPPSHRLLQDALARGVEVIGELELAWRLRGPVPARWLLVTGTNGKTTTVRMLEAILQAAGLRCRAVGNVGVPIIDAVMADLTDLTDLAELDRSVGPGGPGPGYDVLAVEASSFQLTFLDSVVARAGVLLNLAEDHLDWHGSMADYAAQKAKVWRSEVAVVSADDPAVMELAEQSGVDGAISFTLAEPVPGQLGVVGGVLTDRAFSDSESLLAADAIRPAGDHNVANALAAIALARTVGVTAADVVAGLTAFVPDRHRNQFVLTSGGVDWIDDSKATNPHAAAASLAAYPRVVWVAGGQLKGADIEPLVRRFAARLAGAVLLGVDRELVRSAIRRHAPDLPVICLDRTDHGVMIDVVSAAVSLARPGDVVLLAPAAASKDMFSGYDVRGDAFATAVRSIVGSQA